MWEMTIDRHSLIEKIDLGDHKREENLLVGKENIRYMYNVCTRMYNI